jgi:hypothetical protein
VLFTSASAVTPLFRPSRKFLHFLYIALSRNTSRQSVHFGHLPRLLYSTHANGTYIAKSVVQRTFDQTESCALNCSSRCFMVIPNKHNSSKKIAPVESVRFSTKQKFIFPLVSDHFFVTLITADHVDKYIKQKERRHRFRILLHTIRKRGREKSFLLYVVGSAT